MMRVDLTGQAEVHAAFKSLVPKVQKLALARLAAAVHDDVRDRIDDHTKTGALLQSLRIVSSDGDYFIYNDLQRAPHAKFVHWGTKPHPIFPKGRTLATQKELWGRDKNGKGRFQPMPKGRRLVLRWPIPGGFRYAQHVNHPGYKGDPYFAHAAAEAPKHFARIVSQLQREL